MVSPCKHGIVISILCLICVVDNVTISAPKCVSRGRKGGSEGGRE